MMTTAPPPTFFVTDREMLRHKNEWDPTHIELPERLERIVNQLEQSGLADECVRLPSRRATKEEILLVHDADYFHTMEKVQSNSLAENEELSSNYEDIYLNQYSFDCALLSAGCALQVTEAVLKEPGSNAYAAIRPPGHHAAPKEGCGFCIFNNAAICAKRARQLGVQRVLIVDFDVHAGQGTQYCIEDDAGIMLTSIHRYEHGHFWPNLRESGIRSGYNQTINIPLERNGLGDGEYCAFMDIFVRALVTDFKPEFIIISCGYDAAYGDREGEMQVTPAGYAHLVGSLASLGLPLVVLLEGGYFLDTLPQDACFCVQALLDRQPSRFLLGFPYIANVNREFMQQLYLILNIHRNRFPTFGLIVDELERFTRTKLQFIEPPYTGERDCAFPYPTRNNYGAFLDLDHFQKMFREQLLPRYTPDSFRQPLQVLSKNDGKTVSIELNNAFLVEITPSRNPSTRSREISFVYFCILFPLQWQFHVDWSEIHEYLVRSEGDGDEPTLMLPCCPTLLKSVLMVGDN